MRAMTAASDPTALRAEELTILLTGLRIIVIF